MIPLDPKKAAKVGEEWGKAVTDSVFGIVDVVDKHKQKVKQVQANNEANKGAIEHNKTVDEQQKILKKIAMDQIAREQEQAVLQAMSPAQREAYHKAKIATAKAKAKRELQEAESAEEMKQLLQIFAAIFIGFPILIYFVMFMFCAILASTDRGTYREIAPYVPYARAVFGR
jgi:hypothetical protein